MPKPRLLQFWKKKQNFSRSHAPILSTGKRAHRRFKALVHTGKVKKRMWRKRKSKQVSDQILANPPRLQNTKVVFSILQHSIYLDQKPSEYKTRGLGRGVKELCSRMWPRVTSRLKSSWAKFMGSDEKLERSLSIGVFLCLLKDDCEDLGVGWTLVHFLMFLLTLTLMLQLHLSPNLMQISKTKTKSALSISREEFQV